MKLSATINSVIDSLPTALQATTIRWFDRLCESYAAPAAADLPDLARVVACSEFAAGVLLRNWATLGDKLATFHQAPDGDALARFADDFGTSDASLAEAKASLRRERNRQLTHILWRDIVGDASVSETLEALSDVADQLLRGASEYAVRQMPKRFGQLRDDNGTLVPMVIIGMGKLGGHELNFSSDIDIIFAYPRDGVSDGQKQLHAQQYFDRISRYVIALLDEVTADGFVFRTDTRLRPFGDSGPPVVSFAALEAYLLQHGREWERYAYIKARIVGARPEANVQRDLFENLIQPFVYRRYLDYGVFEALREMHAMISTEVKQRELAQNIKLGPGGIREIEFIVQSLQLVRGGRRLELQSPSLLSVLPLLVDAKGISQHAADGLTAAYLFLRRLENLMQAAHDKQTHELPDDEQDRARLCFAMEVPNWDVLTDELERHRRFVSQQFNRIAFRGSSAADDQTVEQRLSELWGAAAGAAEWQQALEKFDFRDAAVVAKHVITFRDAPTTRKIGTVASVRLQTFVCRLLTLARERQHPALAVARSLQVIERVLRRSAYLALLNENRLAAERLVSLCERSAYITDELARFPVLLDELLDPRLLTGPMSKGELKTELDEHLSGFDDGLGGIGANLDSEQHMELLAQFQRGNMFRVAVADFSGELPIMKVSDSLTFLAETVLEHALAVAWKDLTSKHGVPRYEIDGESRTAGFGVIAYGKLGGLELSYGSDLDIVFLHDSRGKAQLTDGSRPLDNSMFFSRLVRRLVHFLTTRTTTGALYEIDTRLRPSGRKGLLVTSTDAFERYQEENAWTWEHQALLRARAVAGSEELAKEFERIRADTLTQRVKRDTLKDDVLSMRARMRKELDRSDVAVFDLKQGVGGIGDIEFLVQYLVLSHAATEPSVFEFTDNIRQLDALAASGIVTPDTAAALQDIYRIFRLRQHHLVLNDEEPLVAADDFTEERATVVLAWEQAFES
ncbi:MAG: bifunctional [glutamate--ammonia ligase]-adenylyl-L-tyrosine phosphorylase/[glutamate--ammonia-ligase] adenylyltransferase [Gammaproteobacteria bacterium]|nr:bifunctional [glutamate--ammonia ligase]-adenylyl-L-tyrosine phosphorylase/[glutamate--ammonia-ligase] adenylyltransferase [Gammaproteobacteria bacterium]